MLLHSCASGTLLTRRRLNSSRTPVCAAGNSPWGSPPSKGGNSSKGKGGSSGQGKAKPARDSKKSKASGKSSGDALKKPKGSTSGQGFAPKPQVQPSTHVHKITPPLTPQMLDELSPWESVAAPLWGTFCGHCEGEWLGQYSAYTPWGGDPEPVWADESGAYLTNAFCRVSEDRQSIPADAADNGADDSSSSSRADPSQDAEMLDVLVRSTRRSASIASLIGGVSATAAAAAANASSPSSSTTSSSLPAASAAAGGSPEAAEDEELEAIAYNINGSAVFNGGSYSLGPEVIEVPELDEASAAEYYAALEDAAAAHGGADVAADEGDEPADPLSALPSNLVVIEQALVAAGDKRVRLVATLKLRQPPGQELDIEVARLLLYKEYWYGTADSTSSGSKRLQLLPAHSFDVPVTQLSRPQPTAMGGTWNVFVMAANPAVEENPNTLQMETVLLYSSREERQHWHVPTLTSSAAPAGTSSSGARGSSGNAAAVLAANQQAAEADSDDGSGGSFWLPGGAVVTLRMVDNPLHAAEPDRNGSSSSSGSAHRGLLVGLHLLDGAGSCLFVEREYDPAGRLFEVRQGTAVKGGWSGGRM